MIIYKILQVSTGEYFDDHNKWSDKPRIYTRKSFAESSIKEHQKLYKRNKDFDIFKNLEDVRIVEEEYTILSYGVYKPFEKKRESIFYY